MGIWGWIADNWYDLATLILGSGLWVSAISLHAEAKARRISNLFSAIHNHRELWTDYYRRPELARVMDPNADVGKKPPTPAEAGFVKLVIQHTSGVYQAIRSGLTVKPEGAKRDIGTFFNLPVPKAVWDKVKIVQDKEFISFMQNCMQKVETAPTVGLTS
jgi:hypothetical protein